MHRLIFLLILMGWASSAGAFSINAADTVTFNGKLYQSSGEKASFFFKNLLPRNVTLQGEGNVYVDEVQGETLVIGEITLFIRVLSQYPPQVYLAEGGHLWAKEIYSSKLDPDLFRLMAGYHLPEGPQIEIHPPILPGSIITLKKNCAFVTHASFLWPQIATPSTCTLLFSDLGQKI